MQHPFPHAVPAQLGSHHQSRAVLFNPSHGDSVLQAIQISGSIQGGLETSQYQIAVDAGPSTGIITFYRLKV